MIDRLKSIELQDFRNFSDKVFVPLDSEVVLISGPNGAGKTSLISAIEIALTGTVRDLERFEADYPGCLINVAAGSASITLNVVSESAPLSIDADVIKSSVRTSAPLSAEDKEYFSSRSYLSQSRLQKILDVYETFDDEGLGGVGFLKSIFGNQVLDEVIAGLSVFKNNRSVANNSNFYADAEEQLGAVSSKIDTNKSMLKQLDVDMLGLIAKSKVMLEPFRDSHEEEIELSGSLDSIDFWTEKAKTITAKHHPRTQLRYYEGMQAELQAAINTLKESGGQEELSQLDLLRSRLETLGQKLESIGISVSAFVSSAETEFEKLAVYPYLDEKPDLMHRRAIVLQETLRRRLVEVETERQRARELRDELKSFEALHNSLTASIRDNENVLYNLEEKAGIAGELTRILEHIKNDECPVCARDFGELNKGSLAEFVSARIGELGLNAGSMEHCREQLSELRSKRELLDAQIKSMNTQLAGMLESEEHTDQLHVVLSSLIDRYGSLEARIAELQAGHEELAELRASISAIKSRLVLKENTLNSVLELADRIGVKISDTELTEFWAPVFDKLAGLIDETEGRVELLDRLTVSLEELTNVAGKADRLRRELDELTRRKASLARRLEQAENTIQVARSIRQKAVTTKENIYKTVFGVALNKLYADIFTRLVSTERFVPAMKEPTKDRWGTLTSGVRALLSGKEKFENARAVLSAGNISTAALSLFITLNLMEEPRHSILILDDPVQSMDDIKVTQLARTLKTISRDHGRQVIMSIHERPLFDSLSLEMRPRNVNETLLTVEMETDGTSVSIDSDIVEWESDAVELEIHGRE